MTTANGHGVEISTDKSRLDLDLICDFLHRESYWAKDRSRHLIEQSIEHAICFGVYRDGRQIGFARAVTDRSTVFYLGDFFILPDHQRSGIGGRLMEFILNHEDLKGLRGILTTQTAHRFYEKYGFADDNEIVTKRIMVLPAER